MDLLCFDTSITTLSKSFKLSVPLMLWRLLYVSQPITRINTSFASIGFKPYHSTMLNGDLDRYRQFLLPSVPGSEIGPSGPIQEVDWTANLDLSTASQLASAVFETNPLRVLVLYGSLRER